ARNARGAWEVKMERVMDEQISTADLVKSQRDADRRPHDQDTDMGPLVQQDMVQTFRTNWDRIQTDFVDDPRTAVQRADELVAQAIQHLAENFAAARNRLEEQWSKGDNVSTEDLRVALRKYR